MRNSDVTVTPPANVVPVPTLARRTEDETRHLRDDHQLTPVVAWVKAPVGAKAEACTRSSSAARMARSRARKAEAGLVSCYVPAPIVEEVKAAGGWDAWRAQGSVAAPSKERCSPAPSLAAENGLRAFCVRCLIRLIELIQQRDTRPGAVTTHKEETSC